MKDFKKIITCALALAMILSLGACGSSASKASPSASSAAAATAASFKTVKSGELHMATNAQFPPYEMIKDGSTSDYEGIDVEIAGKIADKLGLKLVVDNLDFKSVITSVQTGKEDFAMAGLTVTPERKDSIDFSDSYATGKQVFIVKDGSSYATAKDLQGHKIGTQEATTGYIYCSDTPENNGFGADNVTAFNTGALAVQALEDGKVDAVVIDSAPAQEYVKANKGLKILETPYVTEDYAIGLPKDNKALGTAINDALKALIADGTVKSIIGKYIKAS